MAHSGRGSVKGDRIGQSNRRIRSNPMREAPVGPLLGCPAIPFLPPGTAVDSGMGTGWQPRLGMKARASTTLRSRSAQSTGRILSKVSRDSEAWTRKKLYVRASRDIRTQRPQPARRRLLLGPLLHRHLRIGWEEGSRWWRSVAFFRFVNQEL
jgi:hypothetical protein